MEKLLSLRFNFTFLLFFLFSLSTTFAICVVPENESLRDVSYFPEEFSVKCENPDLIARLFGESGCLGVVDSLCIDSVSPSIETIKSSFLNDAERNAFENVIEDLDASVNFHKSAKIKKNDLFIQLGELFLDICNETITPPFLVGFLSCPISAALYDSSAISVVSEENSALEKSSMALNEVLEVLKKESDELYCMGAGSNFTTTNVYFRVRDFSRIINQKLSGDSTDFSKKWSSQLSNAWNIYDFANKGIGNCASAKFLNYTIGKESLVIQALSLYRDIVSAKASLLNEYEAKRNEVKNKLDSAIYEFSNMNTEEYEKIMIYDLITFYNETEGFVTLPVPATYVSEINALLYGRGFEEGAKKDYDDAVSIYQAKDTFYVVNAIKKLGEANNKLNTISEKINTTKSFVSSLLSNAEEKTASAKAAAEEAISNYQASGKVEVELLNTALSKKSKADSIYINIPQKKIGQRIKDYTTSFLLYNEVKNILSDKTKYIEIKKNDLNKSISLLESVIKRAKTDDIDTSVEEIVLSNSKALLSIAKNESDFELIETSVNSALDSIYTRANTTYSFLNDERSRIIDEIKALSAIPGFDASAFKKTVSSFDSYLEDGKYSPQKTLGKYKTILTSFRNVDDEISKRRASAFSSYLGNKIVITKNLPSTVKVNEKTEVETIIEINNDLSFGANESFVVRVPNVKLDLSSQITTPQNVRVASYGSGLDILFEGIKPITKYVIWIKSNQTIVEVSTRAEKTLLFTKDELRKRIDIAVDSLDDLKNVVYEESLLTDECRAYFGLETKVSVYSSGISVLLNNVKKGRNSFYIICTKYTPVTLTESDQLVSTEDGKTKIEYYITARSNIGYIENFVPQIFIPASNTTNVAVYDSSNVPANGFTFMKYGGSFLVKWNIPALTDLPQVFRITYEVSDPSSHLNQLKEEITNIASNESINIDNYISRASSSISSGNYKEALETLQAAKRVIDAERNLRVQKAAIEEKLRKLESSFNLSSVSNFSFGLGEITLEINKKLTEFESKKKEVESALNQNKTSEASQLIKELEKIADTVNIDKIFDKKEKEIFNRIQILKGEFFTLSKILNVTTYMDELDIVEKSLLLTIEKISNKQYADAWMQIENISGKINNLSSIKENEMKKLLSIVSSNINTIKNYQSDWSKLKPKIENALKIFEDNPGRRISTENIEKKISEVDDSLAKVEKFYEQFKKANITYIIDNIDAIKTSEEDIRSIGEGIKYLNDSLSAYKTNTQNTLDVVKTLLSSKMKNASKEDMVKIESLSTYLNKAKKSFDDGNYLDSMLYLDYIKKKVDELPLQSEISFDPITIAGVFIIIFSTIVALLLMRKEEKKIEYKKLKKIDEESE